jgi:cytochrome c5
MHTKDRKEHTLRIRNLSAIGSALSVLLILAAVGCAPVGKASQLSGGAELVANKCTVCHPIDRINQANHDRAGWVQTIARMRGKGAVLSDTEAAQIADYLSKPGAGK